MSRLQFAREAVEGWGRLRPDDDLLEMGVIQHLIWCGRLAEGILEDAAVASGLRRRGDYEVLAVLRRAEPVFPTPLQVAQQLQISPSGMTGKLDRLERQGLLQRTPDPDDRRAVRLGITEAGRDLIDNAFTENLSTYRAMLSEFTPREAKALEAMFEKLLSKLDDLAARPERWKGPVTRHSAIN